MVKVLFVCLGNICRSPLAEGIFREYCIENKVDIYCDSAGTAGYHIGSLPDKRSIQVAQVNGIQLTHLGRKLVMNDFQEFDYIVAMDNQNFEDIMNVKRSSKGKAVICLFRDFDPIGKGDVPDPYYGDYTDFEHVFAICSRSSPNFLEFILKSKI